MLIFTEISSIKSHLNKIEKEERIKKESFTILKRITGNNLNFDIKIILNRIVYDRDFK